MAYLINARGNPVKWALLPFGNEETVSEKKACLAIHAAHLLNTYYVLGDEGPAGDRHACPRPLEESGLAKDGRHQTHDFTNSLLNTFETSATKKV